MKSKPTNTDPYLRMTELLYTAFAHFNQVLADGELKRPIITVGTRGRKSALGWHSAKRWQHNGEKGETLNEINICAERISRPWDEICETLIHEMGHLWNSQHDIIDCNAVQYHNKRFKEAAERFGLIVHKIKGKGFAHTELGEKARKAIESLGIKQSEVPVIERLESRRAVSTPNSFILCTHEDKTRFLKHAATEGKKQIEFTKLLLNLYQLAKDQGFLAQALAESENEVVEA